MNIIKRILKIAGIVLAAIVLLFIALIIIETKTGTLPATLAQPTQAEHTAARPTTVPTPRATLTPVIVPTVAPTPTARPVIVATHAPAVLNNAQLGSTLASFKAKYGIDSPQSDTETAFVEGPGLHQGSLIVTYNTHGIVTRIIYSGPDGWTHAQYAAMMLTWIPADAVLMKSTPDLSTYKSVSVGTFDEQFTGVVAGVYSV